MTAMRCQARNGDWQCERDARRLKSGLCGGHTAQVLRGVDPLRPLKRQAYGGRPSQKHIRCFFPGCEKPRHRQGLCAGHDAQRQKGKELTAIRVIEPHPILDGWNRPWTHEKSGYAYVSRRGDGTRKRLEHRVMMEYMIGRPLLRNENVHHINGIRDDNRPENLELWSTMQPSGQRIADKLEFARAIIELYG